MQGLKICDDFLILELGSSDIILGLQWLEKLGDITTNWKEQIMKFSWEGQFVELRGDPSLGVTQISLKAMERVYVKRNKEY